MDDLILRDNLGEFRGLWLRWTYLACHRPTGFKLVNSRWFMHFTKPQIYVIASHLLRSCSQAAEMQRIARCHIPSRTHVPWKKFISITSHYCSDDVLCMPCLLNFAVTEISRSGKISLVSFIMLEELPDNSRESGHCKLAWFRLQILQSCRSTERLPR
jgi:hypothetical protein